MKIGGDHDRGLGETLRDGDRSVSEPQGYPAHGEESPYPTSRGGGGVGGHGGRGGVGAWRRGGVEACGVETLVGNR